MPAGKINERAATVFVFSLNDLSIITKRIFLVSIIEMSQPQLQNTKSPALYFSHLQICKGGCSIRSTIKHTNKGIQPMPAPEIIKDLVKRFENNRESYRSGKYNETQLRREFLDPFLEALGWDVINKQGYAETYKDVIHEDSLEIEGENKAPDYAFRISGV